MLLSTSHDWAKIEHSYFIINAKGTLNILELTKKLAQNHLLFLCQLKVYGDKLNNLPLVEKNKMGN